MMKCLLEVFTAIKPMARIVCPTGPRKESLSSILMLLCGSHLASLTWSALRISLSCLSSLAVSPWSQATSSPVTLLLMYLPPTEVSTRVSTLSSQRRKSPAVISQPQLRLKRRRQPLRALFNTTRCYWHASHCIFRLSLVLIANCS